MPLCLGVGGIGCAHWFSFFTGAPIMSPCWPLVPAVRLLFGVIASAVLVWCVPCWVCDLVFCGCDYRCAANCGSGVSLFGAWVCFSCWRVVVAGVFSGAHDNVLWFWGFCLRRGLLVLVVGKSLVLCWLTGMWFCGGAGDS